MSGPETRAISRPDAVPIVAGIIRGERGILLARRPDDAHLGGLWEFPGGKVDEGESPRAALIREIREELDIGVRVGSLYLEVEHSYPDRTLHIRFFECWITEGSPVSRQATALQWVQPGDLPALPMPEANRAVIEMLRSS